MHCEIETSKLIFEKALVRSGLEKNKLIDQKCGTVQKKNRFLNIWIRKAGLSQAGPWPMV